MYDRAARFLDAKPSLNNVGPGSYGTHESKYSKCEGYAPFSALQPRESLLTKDSNKNGPGPGSYDPNFIYDHIKGGSTIGNRSVRFDQKISDTPGPGNYNIVNGISSKSKKNTETNNAIKGPSAPRYTDPPSIPCPGQAFGYEEGVDGILRKQKAPDVDGSLGPAFYNVNHDDTAASRKYKGVHFGAKTGRRIGESDFNENPGPGTYSVHQAPRNLNLLIVEEQKKKTVDAKLPRYHELIPVIETKRAVPGPGKYEVKSTFEATEPVYDASLRPSFGSQSKRFNPVKESTPAPDAYDDKRLSLECTVSASTQKHPFSQSSKRFENTPQANMTPSPNSYNITGLVENLQKKAMLSSNLKGAFGSSSARVFSLRKKADDAGPGPQAYSPHSAPHAKSDRRSFVFKSSSNRLSNHAQPTPSPGSYDIKRTFSKPKDVLCKIPGKPIDGGFLSSTKRFSQPRDIVVKKVDHSIPGPGEYNVKPSDGQSISIVTNVDRFKGKENDVPGPGSYQLSPLLQHTVLKGTYNVTLNNPVKSALVEADDRSSQLSLTVTG